MRVSSDKTRNWDRIGVNLIWVAVLAFASLPVFTGPVLSQDKAPAASPAADAPAATPPAATQPADAATPPKPIVTPVENLKVERVPSLLSAYAKAMQQAEKEKGSKAEDDQEKPPTFFGLAPIINPSPEMQMLLGSARLPVQKITSTNGVYDKHFDAATSLSVSYDGTMVLSGSADRTAQLWNLSDKKTIRVFRDDFNHRQGVTDVCLSNNQLYAATASYDGSIRLWSVKSGKNVKSYLGLKDRVWAVSISPNGMWIAGAADDGTIQFWDMASVKKLGKLTGHAGAVYDLDFSYDSSVLVSAGADGVARIWDLANFREVVQLAGHTDRVYSANLSPMGGNYVLTGSADKTARLWDTYTGKELCRFIGHTGAVRAAVFLSLPNREKEQGAAGGPSRGPGNAGPGATPAGGMAGMNNMGMAGAMGMANSQGAAGSMDRESGGMGAGQTRISGFVATAGDDGTIRIWMPSNEPAETQRGNGSTTGRQNRGSSTSGPNSSGPNSSGPGMAGGMMGGMPGMAGAAPSSAGPGTAADGEETTPEEKRPGSKAKGIELVEIEVGKAVFDLAVSPAGLVAACEDGLVRIYAIPDISASLEQMKTMREKLDGTMGSGKTDSMMQMAP